MNPERDRNVTIEGKTFTMFRGKWVYADTYLDAPPAVVSAVEQNGVHYCNFPTERIRQDILQCAVPESALVRRCCWKRICQVQAKSLRRDSPEWSKLCRLRSQLPARH